MKKMRRSGTHSRHDQYHHHQVHMRRFIALFAWPLALIAMLAGCNSDGDAAWPAGQPPVAVGNELMGTLVPGTIEAGGGYLVGAAPDRLDGEARDRRFARQAVDKARNNPATVEEARGAPTADLNDDGFITTDELIALSRAGVADQELLRQLEATGQVFEVGPAQQDYLLAHDVGRTVVARLPRLNSDARQRLLRDRMRR